MDGKVLQLTQLYVKLELIYLEMLTLTQGLQDLCVNNSFMAEGDREKLAELLFRREELMEQATAQQKEAGALEKSLRESLNAMKGSTSSPPKHGFQSAMAIDQFSEVPRRLELLAKEIIALDTVTGQALRRSLQHAAREMEKIQTGKKANKAYKGQDYQSEGFFIDFSK